MIKRYNNMSLALGVPGIILQIVGNIMSRNPGQLLLGLLLALVGTGLLLAGLAYYALAKGRNPAWCLMAFLSIIGLIVLACLKDLVPDGEVRKRRRPRDREEDYDDEYDDDGPRRRRRRREDDDVDEEDDDQPRRRKRSRDEDDDELEASPSRKEEVIEAEAIKPAVPEKKLVTCTNCQKSLKVSASLIGKKVKCPGCGEVFAA